MKPVEVPCSTESAPGFDAAQLPKKRAPVKPDDATAGEPVVVGEAEAALAVANDELPSSVRSS